jgi:hypothetical protein
MKPVTPSPMNIGIEPDFWFDFSDVNGITLADTDRITDVKDDSFVGFDLDTRGNDSHRPIYDTSKFSKKTAIFATGSEEYSLLGASPGPYSEVTFAISFSPTAEDENQGYVFSEDGSGTNPGDCSFVYSGHSDHTVKFIIQGVIEVFSKTKLNDNKMHLAVITLSAKSGIRMHIDGILESESFISDTIWSGAIDFELGSVLAGGISFFGNIGEMCAFGKELSDVQIKKLTEFFSNKWGSSNVGYPTQDLLGFFSASNETDVIRTGNAVISWTDLSINGNDAVQTITGSKPNYNATGLNGSPTIRYDGINDYLVAPIDISTVYNSEITIYVVCQYFVSNSGLFGTTTSELNRSLILDAALLSDKSALGIDDSSGVLLFDSPPQGTPMIVKVAFSEGENSVYIDGIKLASASVLESIVGLQGMTIGSSNTTISTPFSGDISAILVYAREIGDLEDKQIMEKLSNQWGIQFPSFRQSNLDIWMSPNNTDTVTLNVDAVSDVEDFSGNGNDASRSEAVKQPDWDITSMALRSIRYNEDTSLQSVNYGGGSGFTNLTILAVIKQDSVLTNTNRFILSKDGGGLNIGDGALIFGGEDQENKVSVGFRDQWNAITVDGRSDVRDDASHVVSFRLSSSAGYSLRIDGVEEDSNSTTSNTLWNNNTLIEFGGVSNATFNSFLGSMGDALIWGASLTDAELFAAERYFGDQYGIDIDSTSQNGLKLWMDASDYFTVKKNGTDVSQWLDKSKNQRVFEQGTAVNQFGYTDTQNGKNVMTLTGQNYMTDTGPASYWDFLSNGSEVTVIVIARTSYSAPQSRQRIFSTCDASDNSTGIAVGVYEVTGSINRFSYLVSEGSGTYSLSTEGAPAFNDSFVHGIYNIGFCSYEYGMTGDDLEFNLNGSDYASRESVIAPSASAPDSTMVIGADSALSQFMYGELCEILVYDRHMNAAEKNNIIAARQLKWGL